MNIIQANKFYYPRGGAETYLLEISHWLQTQGHHVIPFAMHHPSNLPTPYEQYFVTNVQTNFDKLSPLFQGGFAGAVSRIHTFGRMLYSLQARRKLATLIVQAQPDLCHLHNIYTQISPSILHTLSDLHIPTVMTVHDHHLISPQYNIWVPGCGKDYRQVGLWKGTISKFHKQSMAASFAQIAAYKLHRLLRIYEHHIGLFIAPSYYLKRQLLAGGFPKEKIRVNHYGIDTQTTTPSYTHNGSFLSVGRLSEEKGIETIISLAKQLPTIDFDIVGRGPNMAYLHRLALDAPNVRFLGFRNKEELKVLYQQACAVLLPSRVQEIFPLVLLEAMVHGTPVIANDVGGISEVIEDRISGLLVQPTDRHGWIEAIIRLAYDQDFQQSLAIGARARVEQHFRLEDHHQRLMNIYREIT